VASIFVPGHPPVHQPKLHLTPTERNIWRFEPGQEIHVIETDFGRMGVSICYDVQFPEVARLQAEQGVQLLVVPYLTDDRRGCSRVTTCARARAVENQIYVVTAGMVGSLPLITDLTAQYAQSGIYTPSDFPFPMDGIATEAAANSEMVLVGDIDLALLDQARARGSVLNHQDAAQDGLHVTFDGRIRVHHLPWLDQGPALPAPQG
jgi:predicted amidohydrolase